MKSLDRFSSIFNARNKEFFRDKGTLIWAFVFPMLLLVGFSFLFNRDAPQEQALIAITGQHKVQWQEKINQLPYVKALSLPNKDEAFEKLKHHQFDLLLDTTPTPPVYYMSQTSPKAYTAEQLVLGPLERKTKPNHTLFKKESIQSTEVPYLDWFFPGLLGMNTMFSAVFGVGYVIVRYRKDGVLKRLSSTPLSAFEFLSAQLASRLLIALVTNIVLIGASVFLFDFTIHGSYLALVAIFTFGASSLVSVGLLVATRMESEELAGGVLNLITWPMMFLSEVWFSLESSPVWIQKLAWAFPLTHLIRGARAIMNDGAGLADIAHHLVILAIITLICLSLGAKLFRWHPR